MPEIRTIQNPQRRISVIEDPNSAYSRIFIDTVAHDLTTLTPYWTKTFHYNYDGFQHVCSGNAYVGGAAWTSYMAACHGPGSEIRRAGIPYNGSTSSQPYPWNMLRAYQQDTRLQYPATDDGFFRMGIMHLQKGTISCYAAGDSYANQASIASGAMTGSKSTMNFQFDTYHQSLNFNTYPAKKSHKLLNGGNVMLWPGDRGHNLLGSFTNHTGLAAWMNANDGWALYGDDLTANAAVHCTVQSLNGAMQTVPGSTIIWEDSANASLWTISNANPCKPFVTRVVNPNTKTPTFHPFRFWNELSSTIVQPGNGRMNYRLFFIGVDSSNSTYWLTANDMVGGSPFHVQRLHVSATEDSTPVLVLNSINNGGGTYTRTTPSNIRVATSNRHVFYSSHYDGSNVLTPFRFVFAPLSNTISSDICTVNYGAGNTHATFAAMMQTSGVETANNANPWMNKPMQHTTSQNNYVTFWFADQAAGIVDSNGPTRWNTRQRRTMLTFSLGSSTNDNILSYHSHYVFPTVYDIPKNFMPTNANCTTMMVPSTYKTQFFKFSDTIGWYVASEYKTEFRSMGMDSTNRIWGYSMDENNGNIHIIDTTIPSNVSVVMSNTNFTYTGTTLSPTATVNAYNYEGDRVTANVTLTIDGSSMSFATNSSKTLSLTTSNTVDTIVNLSIAGGGVNNIYAAISV
jgi:hypothetical protein